MQDKKLAGADDLIVYEKSQRAEIRILQQTLKSKTEDRKVLQRKYENVRDYVKFKKYYIEYKRGGSKAAYRELHQNEINSYLRAEAYLKRIGIDEPGRDMLNKIFNEDLLSLNNEIKELRENLKNKKTDLQETAIVRSIYEESFNESLNITDDFEPDIMDIEEEKERNDGPLTK